MSDRKRKFIHLTTRPAVSIIDDEWPRIADTQDHEENNPNTHIYVCVRRHEDGRHLVYGESHSQWANVPSLYAGYLIGTEGEVHIDGLVDTMRDVLNDLGRFGEGVSYAKQWNWDLLLENWVDDLPAVEL